MSRILVIEDDEPSRILITTNLRREGYEVLEADDGARGLEMARAKKPDLVISDIFLPGLTGTELLVQLRGDPQIAATPFILMTSETGSVPMRQGMGMGADDYLPKPFTSRVLIEAVKTRLNRHRVMVDRAESKLKSLREDLSFSLPHELLTPIAGILGYAELIRTDFESLRPGEVMKMAASIEECAARLRRLIHNYLLYTDLDLLQKSHDQLKSAVSTSATVSRKVVAKAARLCAQRHARLDNLVLELAEVPVSISEDYLSKITDELTDNAFKFSRTGTTVKVTAVQSSGQFQLSVQDQGRGLSAEQIKEIGPYRQFDRKKYEHQGMGLGLYLARRLAEIHGGRLGVQSEAGQGATVVVTIPSPSQV